MRTQLHLILCVILGLAASAQASWSGLALDARQTDEGFRIDGQFFRLLIDPRQGGEVVELQIHDGERWQSIIAPGKGAFPRLTIRGADDALLPATPGQATVELWQPDANHTRLRLSAPLQRPDGCTVTWDYEIFPEGGVFVSFTLRGHDASNAASIALCVNPDLLSAARFSDQQLAKSTPGFPSARIAVGMSPQRSYTCEMEAVVERRDVQLGASYQSQPGEYVWHLWNDADALSQHHATDDGQWRYENRIALGLSNSPYPTSRSNVIGERVMHWVNFLDIRPDHWYPTDEEIQRMADAGASMLILHHEWMMHRGSNGNPHADYSQPRNDAEMRRTIATAHRLGLRVGIYMRGIERYGIASAFFERYAQRNFDGIYIDWHGAQAIAFHEGAYEPETALGDQHFSPDGTIVPARAYFEFIRQVRQIVGDEGFIIGHLGAFNSGVLANLGIDGYLAGETASEHALFQSTDDAVFRGMMAGAVVMPWPEEAASFSQTQARAKMAAWGMYPHILLGMDKPSTGVFPRDPLAERHQGIQAYWRLLGQLRDRRHVRVLNLPADACVAAIGEPASVQCVIYQESDGSYFLIVSNLSDTRTQARIKFDQALGMNLATLRAAIIASDDEEAPANLTMDSDGLAIGLMEPWQSIGIRLDPVPSVPTTPQLERQK